MAARASARLLPEPRKPPSPPPSPLTADNLRTLEREQEMEQRATKSFQEYQQTGHLPPPPRNVLPALLEVESQPSTPTSSPSPSSRAATRRSDEESQPRSRRSS